MTTILYSEGALDLGEPGLFVDEDHQGPLRLIVEGLLDQCDWLQLEPRKFGRVHGGRDSHGLSGFAKKVYRALKDAELDGETALIIVVDRDGTPRRSRFDELDEGCTAAGSTVPCAIGVAQEMVEAWLLGDPGAFQRAFGADAARPPHDPEVSTTANSRASAGGRLLCSAQEASHHSLQTCGSGLDHCMVFMKRRIARRPWTRLLERRGHGHIKNPDGEMTAELLPIRDVRELAFTASV
ncbi:MAG: hypothetical protein AAFV53_42430 [Myxococcota bacterium]